MVPYCLSVNDDSLSGLNHALLSSTFVEVWSGVTRFEKWIAAGTLAVLAFGSAYIPYRNYRHAVEHDTEQEEQAKAALAANTKIPATLPNLDKTPEEKAPDPQSKNETEKPVEEPPENSAEQAQQPTVQSPAETPKPFTFWGYLSTGQNRTAIPGILFEVKSCNVDRTLVTCIMSATSPRYDRQLFIDMFGTTITDSDADSFRMQPRNGLQSGLQLDRDSPVPFKLEFPVNKDLVKPIVVRINGYVPQAGNLQDASFSIGRAEP